MRRMEEKPGVIRRRKGRTSTHQKVAKAWNWIRRHMARSFPRPNPPADERLDERPHR